MNNLKKILAIVFAILHLLVDISIFIIFFNNNWDLTDIIFPDSLLIFLVWVSVVGKLNIMRYET